MAGLFPHEAVFDEAQIAVLHKANAQRCGALPSPSLGAGLAF
jgi:hypothetical protein